MGHKFALGEVVDGRYELRRLLGRGSDGIVYEAWHRFLGQRVALKVIADDAPEPVLKKRRARLLREARVLSALRHPGVVCALDTGVVSGEPYLAMELLDGKTLEGLLAARGKLPWQDVVAVLLEVCEALSVAHARGVLHRDLKPANIFLVQGPDGEHTKLVDFGTSRPVPQDDDVKLTDEGAVIGTPAYMSPEQLMGADDLDGRTDVYALGAIAFECISGRLVYEGNYRAIVRSAFSPNVVPSLRGVAPEIDARLDAIITKALQKERGERYHDVRELATALRALSSPSEIKLLKVVQAVTRRRCERAPFISPVHVMLPKGNVDGRCEDISEGGMLFLSRDEIPQGQIGEVRFALPIEGRVATCQAKVAWARVRPGQILWAAGLEFVDPPATVTTSIARYVELMGDGGKKEPVDDADIGESFPKSESKQTVADVPSARRVMSSK